MPVTGMRKNISTTVTMNGSASVTQRMMQARRMPTADMAVRSSPAGTGHANWKNRKTSAATTMATSFFTCLPSMVFRDSAAAFSLKSIPSFVMDGRAS